MAGPLRILHEALGARRAARVLARFVGATLRREPFRHLPPPDDDRERLSRDQIAPAIRLYRAIQAVAPEHAYAITERVVLSEGAKFLRKELGAVDVVALGRRPPDEREAEAKRLGRRFFNAAMRWDEIGERRVRFTVTACRFPPLCAEAGVPEIAPMFCAVDDAYFGTIDPRLTLTRPRTIARGATECPFTLDRVDDPGS